MVNTHMSKYLIIISLSLLSFSFCLTFSRFDHGLRKEFIRIAELPIEKLSEISPEEMTYLLGTDHWGSKYYFEIVDVDNVPMINMPSRLILIQSPGRNKKNDFMNSLNDNIIQKCGNDDIVITISILNKNETFMRVVYDPNFYNDKLPVNRYNSKWGLIMINNFCSRVPGAPPI